MPRLRSDRPLRAPVLGGGDLLGLGERAVLTDGRAAAVVAADGTFEWWCPALDGDPVLARLVDPGGGALRLALMPGPGEPATEGLLWAGDQHRHGRQVVTVLRTPEAVVELRDDLTDGVLTRLVTVLAGAPWIGWSWSPRAAAGTVARAGLAHRRWSSGMSVGRTVVQVRTDPAAGGALTEGDAVRVEAGGRVTLTAAVVGIDGLPVRTRAAIDQDPERVTTRLLANADAWERACGEIDHDGPRHPLLRRAVSQLRMATVPEGGIVRALTTSLPRAIGNERNLDERLVWLDDTARAVRLWERLGRPDWADAGRDWLAAALADVDEVPAPVRAADGSPPPGERETDFAGWRGHHPVRMGADAAGRVDLGAVAAASLVLDARRQGRALRTVARWLDAGAPDGMPRPDHGRWDQRGRPVRHVASGLAVSRALRAASASMRSRHPLDLEAWSWLDTADALDAWLGTQGLAGRGAGSHWQRTPLDPTTDAMLLRVAAPPEGDPPALADDAEGEAEGRMRSTVDLVVRQLGEGPTLHRHLPHVDDGLPPGQAPELSVSFEAVTALARVGRWEDAHERLDALVRAVAPLPQLPAALDPRGPVPLGNLAHTPAALALAEAVLALDRGPR